MQRDLKQSQTNCAGCVAIKWIQGVCEQNKEKSDDDLRELSFEIPTNGVEKLLFVYEEKVEADQSPFCV